MFLLALVPVAVLMSWVLSRSGSGLTGWCISHCAGFLPHARIALCVLAAAPPSLPRAPWLETWLLPPSGPPLPLTFGGTTLLWAAAPVATGACVCVGLLSGAHAVGPFPVAAHARLPSSFAVCCGMGRFEFPVYPDGPSYTTEVCPRGNSVIGA